MKDQHDSMQSLLELLRHQAPELLSVCRYLVLGPFFSEGLLGEHSRPPAVRDLIMLKRVVERHRPDMAGVVIGLVEASGMYPAVRVESQLDRLIELDPAQWFHPAYVLDRPISGASDLLEACRLRMAEAGEKERGRLATVEEKLERAAQIEDKARKRREKRASMTLTSASKMQPSA